MTKPIVGFLNRIFYPKLSANWDHKIFREEILAHVNSGTVLLDLGAGSGLFQDVNFKGLAQKVYGIDPDPRVMENPYLDEACVGFGESMPMFADGRFDLVISCNVLEHLENPVPFFNEVYRVLKKGGLFITKTPNQWHYMPLVAKFSPAWFHKLFYRLYDIREEDAFPTYYRVNSRKAQTRIARQTGFEVESIHYYEGRPEYLRANFLLYFLGIIYERFVNWFHLNFLKVIIITQFKKI